MTGIEIGFMVFCYLVFGFMLNVLGITFIPALFSISKSFKGNRKLEWIMVIPILSSLLFLAFTYFLSCNPISWLVISFSPFLTGLVIGGFLTYWHEKNNNQKEFDMRKCKIFDDPE